jgi:hypothetical protein
VFFRGVIQDLLFFIIHLFIHFVDITGLSTDDFQRREESLREAAMTMIGVVKSVGDGTTRPWMFAKKLGSI